MDYTTAYLLYVEEQWMICNMRRLTALGICKVPSHDCWLPRGSRCLSFCSTVFVRMVKPLRIYDFADIVKERAFSLASIVRVKNTFGVEWGYDDESRPLIGCILSRDQTT